MTPEQKTRIGVAGYGFIGRELVRLIRETPEWNLELAFVWNRDAAKLAGLPRELVLEDLDQLAGRRPDLVVECAHPAVSRDHGAAILEVADYLPLSVNAFADAQTEARLVALAEARGRRIIIPHGALIGLDNLVEMRDTWKEVTITFRKNPANIDFSDTEIDPATIRAETVVYDGPARGIAGQFPRNVNTMTTCALATVGLDRCRAVLVADPGLDVAIAEVRAVGRDGSIHQSRKEQPVVGVSGTEMLAAQVGSLLRAAHVVTPGLSFA
jgi:predicted dinucleotide-utilizing enzyme